MENTMKAADVMTRDVISIGTGHSVQHAAKIMLSNQISGLPVLNDDGKLVGIITEGDLMRRLELYGLPTEVESETPHVSDAEDYIRNASWRAADCMSPTLITVVEDTPVNRITAMMAANGIKRVPVMHGEEMVGIVSRSDLLECIVHVGSERTIRSDGAIKTAVLARLKFDLHFSPNDVDATVSDGWVNLLGEVASPALSRAAAVAAESVPGVSGVHNQLRVHSRLEA